MSIRYYLIHCDAHEERLSYITKLKEDFNQEITIFKGFDTTHISVDEQIPYLQQINSNLKFTHFRYTRSGQFGCYLSHISLMEHIMKNKESDYSVIFEDDVDFEKDTLHSNIEQIIKHNIEFDILYLGHNFENGGKNNIVDNIYNINTERPCLGTHALLINNKNIEKILKANYNIIHLLDVQYSILNEHNIIKNLIVKPNLCWHANLRTNIG
jgi:GR25 family glycosyltransferase involved in LPS biosynthesis